MGKKVLKTQNLKSILENRRKNGATGVRGSGLKSITDITGSARMRMVNIPHLMSQHI